MNLKDIEGTKNLRWNVTKNIHVVNDALSDSHLKPNKNEKYLNAIKRLTEYFDLSEKQVWIICYSIYYYFVANNTIVCFQEFAQFLATNVLNVVAMNKDFEVLHEKNYINFEPEEAKYTLNQKILKAIISNTALPECQKNNLSYTAFLSNFGEKYDGRRYKDLSSFDMQLELERYENQNRKLPLVKKTQELIQDAIPRYIFYDLCNDFLKGEESSLDLTLDDIAEGNKKFRLARSFMDETNILFKLDLIYFTKKGNLADSTITLTEKGKQFFLEDDYELYAPCMDKTVLKSPEDIQGKELFYNSGTQKQIESLKNSLHEEKFCEIRARLHQKNLPVCVTAIFYGVAGAGKSESVYQIAKETGRAVMVVDISDTKSCWFGESEKKIKKIFMDYKRLCENAQRQENGKIPILLFNEADAIFSRRKDVALSSTAQTENAIQNIILEEVEKLQGILIATTNLVDNFDPAFERRFLFKVKFEKPTEQIKEAIWKSKLEWISEEQCHFLSANYDFTGGEIDNIVKKITMEEVITGVRPSLEAIADMCKVEKLADLQKKKVGFAM